MDGRLWNVQCERKQWSVCQGTSGCRKRCFLAQIYQPRQTGWASSLHTIKRTNICPLAEYTRRFHFLSLVSRARGGKNKSSLGGCFSRLHKAMLRSGPRLVPKSYDTTPTTLTATFIPFSFSFLSSVLTNIISCRVWLILWLKKTSFPSVPHSKTRDKTTQLGNNFDNEDRLEGTWDWWTFGAQQPIRDEKRLEHGWTSHITRQSEPDSCPRELGEALGGCFRLKGNIFIVCRDCERNAEPGDVRARLEMGPKIPGRENKEGKRDCCFLHSSLFASLLQS